MAENCFSLIGKTGAYHDKPTAVDAKRHLKLVTLACGGQALSTSALESEEHTPFISAQMLRSLMDDSSAPKPLPQAVDIGTDQLVVSELSVANTDQVLRSMGIEQSCEFGGKEYLAGSVASKFKRDHPELCATENDLEMSKFREYSWVIKLSQGGLTIPSLSWINMCEKMNQEFDDYHRGKSKWDVSQREGVYKGFCVSLAAKYPEIPVKPLQKYIWTRLSIRMKNGNEQIKEDRRAAAQRRADRWREFQQRENKPFEDEEEEDFEGDEEDLEEEKEPREYIPGSDPMWEDYLARQVETEN